MSVCAETVEQIDHQVSLLTFLGASWQEAGVRAAGFFANSPSHVHLVPTSVLLSLRGRVVDG